MNLRSYLQTRLRIAVVCAVEFTLIRMLGEPMAFGVVNVARAHFSKRERISGIQPIAENQAFPN